METPVASASRQANRAYCSFLLGDACFALAAELVSEFVTVEALMPVPQTPPAILGLFGLRGEPVALVDLLATLRLSTQTSPAPVHLALVLRTDNIHGAFAVDRMHAVERIPASGLTAAGPQEPDVVQGFFTSSRDGRTITVLDPDQTLAHLKGLRRRFVDQS